MRAEENLPPVGVIQGNYHPDPRAWYVQLGFHTYYTSDQVIDICIAALEAAGEAAKKNREAGVEPVKNKSQNPKGWWPPKDSSSDIYHDVLLGGG